MRCLFILAALLFAVPAYAVEIEWVEVGDPGNPPDTEVMFPDGTTGYGSVAHIYEISKYEVTNAQYAEFLNAVAATDTYGLYVSAGRHDAITQSGSPGSYTYSAIPGREHLPAKFMSFYNACRFANWLYNGQPTGAQDNTTTEDGAYTLTAEGMTNNSITRNADATIFLPSEDEWYKAAYYDPVSNSYFDYPAGSDTQTTCAVPGPTANTANCNRVAGDYTEVGSYTNSASPYGTFDQGGNILEWNEATPDGSGIGTSRGVRGGVWISPPLVLASSNRLNYAPLQANEIIGFRVARISDSTTACNDGYDNDGDGTIDSTGGPLGEPADPGCVDASDLSERDPLLACDDGADNDGDDLVDYPDDPGCFNPHYFAENPQCQDGVNNDPGQDGWIDFDGGVSAGVPPEWQTDPDPQCTNPWQNREATLNCGLGAELALLIPPLMWMWRRRSRR